MVPAIRVLETITQKAQEDGVTLTEKQLHNCAVIAYINYYEATYNILFINEIKGNGTGFTISDIQSRNILPALRMSFSEWETKAKKIVQDSLAYKDITDEELWVFFNADHDKIIANIIKEGKKLTMPDIYEIVRAKQRQQREKDFPFLVSSF